MSEKRFIQLADTHIKDTLTGEEWYAPSETSLLKLLNNQEDQINRDEMSIRTMLENMEKLEKENENLKQELNDCEKFRYAVFKQIGELK